MLGKVGAGDFNQLGAFISGYVGTTYRKDITGDDCAGLGANDFGSQTGFRLSDGNPAIRSILEPETDIKGSRHNFFLLSFVFVVGGWRLVVVVVIVVVAVVVVGVS